MSFLSLFRRKSIELDTQLCADRLRVAGFDRLFDASTNAIPPSFRDLWVLHELILKYRPAVVLEYGSGYSTYVIAETLQRLGGGRLISVELDPQWMENTKSIMSVPVELIAPKARIVYYGKVETIVFDELSSMKPDMIYIDGPDPRQIPGYTGEPVVSDILHYEKSRSGPLTICIDGRDDQCEFALNHLSASYRVTTYRPKRFTVLEGR